jgi:predicted esterase
MISIQRGRLTSQALTELVQDYKFHTFPDMGHECSQEELDIVKNFIQEKLPPLPLNNL